ncbi:MAG: AmmeMemoRadiSam system protein B [Chloroflexi bacterium]|nr:AmmeMemoRadiSam system protein B [Chloroflexota bacterium]
MGTQPTPHNVRPSHIVNHGWYPSDPRRLAHTVDEFIARAEVPPINGDIVGILAPHAGIKYSGAVAGHAFKLLQGLDVEVVALVGPSHYRFAADIVTTGHDAYETPLGQVPVDQGILYLLQQRVQIQTVFHDQEHSLEMELPFLQRVLGDFTLVPLALIDHSVQMAQQLGHALVHALEGKKALLVASSDLSHFYPQDVANMLDQVVLDAIEAYEPASVIEAEEQGKGFACGRGAIAAVMIAAQELGADRAQVINYATSGDVTHTYRSVVGYSAAVFYRAES